jgi:hypothetical protein
MLRVIGALALLLGIACAGVCAGPEPAAAPAVAMVLRDGRLSVRLEGVPLPRVLLELKRQTGIESEFLGATPAGVIWQTFSDLPLEDALLRLLVGHSYALYSAAAGHGIAAATPESLRLLIFPRTTTALRNTPVVSQFAQDAPPAVERPVSNTTSDSPVILHPAGSLDALSQAMVDPDENVRARAQQMFEQTIAQPNPSAVGTPQPRR